jgi:hypothetical protein
MQQQGSKNKSGKVLISWRAKSRPYSPIDAQTKSVLTVLVILTSLVLAFAGEWMILVVVAAGVFFYYAWNSAPPEEMDFSITDSGVVAFGRAYMWWEFNRWWMDEKYSMHLLGLELNSGMISRIYIPIEGVKKEDVGEVVGKYLTFDKPKDTLMDKMGKWMVEKFPLRSN